MVFGRLKLPSMSSSTCTAIDYFSNRPGHKQRFFYLWSTLTEIGPVTRGVGEAQFVCSLGTPDYARAGSRGIETGVWAVPFMCVAELAVDLGALFAAKRSTHGGTYTLSLVTYHRRLITLRSDLCSRRIFVQRKASCLVAYHGSDKI